MQTSSYPVVSQIGSSATVVDKKMLETRQQLDEVMNVMRSNIEKMAQRSDRLENLACRAEVLDMSASEFHKCAKEMRLKQGWKTHLYKYLLGAVVVVCALSAIVFW